MSDGTPPEERCCSPFDPAPWDGETVTWSEKKFVKDRVRCLFHVPLNFKRVMVRNVALIEKAGAKPDQMEPDVLEFIQAIDDYKRANGRPFPSWSEVLEIIKTLGYERAEA